MADDKTSGGRKANIGASSLILIFIVLCLATFGLLSLSSAKSDWVLAKRNAAAVSGFYQADAKGEEFVQMVDSTIIETFSQRTETDSCQLLLKDRLKEFYDVETGIIRTDIPMERGQALHIELGLSCDEAVRYEILEWRVYNQEDYEIDNSMPVWTGGG